MMLSKDRENRSRTFKSPSLIRRFPTTSSASLMPPSLPGPRTSPSTSSTTSRCSRLSQISRRPRRSLIRKLRRFKTLKTSSQQLKRRATMYCSATKSPKIISSLRSTVPFTTIQSSAQGRHSRRTLPSRRTTSRNSRNHPLRESKASGIKVPFPTRAVFKGEFDEYYYLRKQIHYLPFSALIL